MSYYHSDNFYDDRGYKNCEDYDYYIGRNYDNKEEPCEYYQDDNYDNEQSDYYNWERLNDVEEHASAMQRLNFGVPEEFSHAPQNYRNNAFGPANFDMIMEGMLDGFRTGNMKGVIKTIGRLTGGQGGFDNLMSNGGLEIMAKKIIDNNNFFHVNPKTGRITNAIAGNIFFGIGGKDNSLSGIGKMILNNFVSGKYQRNVDSFVPMTRGMPSFNLNFAKERARCLQERRLFEDPEFPAAASSLYFSRPPKKRIEWKRPGEIVNDPQLIVSDKSLFDVVQGSLGDCWLLAAVANLTLQDQLFYRVVPPDQSFTENYAGIFHFQFWRYGKWVDVVIDDRLPTYNGMLIYMHSAQHNEFWSALLEKAYSKLYGNYETLKGGFMAEAMVDFTGGIVEQYNLQDTPQEKILAILVCGFQMGSLFGCSIDANAQVIEARLSNGLVCGHAYSITALQMVQTSHGEEILLRIRNPWGRHEWNGAWSDRSIEWNRVSYERRLQLGVLLADDGDFWMCIDDFVREFNRMENCNFGPDVMNEIHEITGITNTPKSVWVQCMIDGAWVSANGTAGGCQNYRTFCNNPQYAVKLAVSGNNVEGDGKVMVIVALLQKYRRERHLNNHLIGFFVFPSTMHHSRGGGSYNEIYRKMDRFFFEHTEAVAKVAKFVDYREVTTRFRVPPGNYIIIPSTFDPNEDGEYLIRIFCNGQITTRELQ